MGNKKHKKIPQVRPEEQMCPLQHQVTSRMPCILNQFPGRFLAWATSAVGKAPLTTTLLCHQTLLFSGNTMLNAFMLYSYLHTLPVMSMEAAGAGSTCLPGIWLRLQCWGHSMRGKRILSSLQDLPQIQLQNQWCVAALDSYAGVK